MIPNHALRKTLRDPEKAFKWILNRIRDPRKGIDDITTHLFGEYIFDRDWDVAIILDACRYDTGQEATTSRDSWPCPTRIFSAGAHSHPWIKRTFSSASEDDLRKTAYISANPYSTQAPQDKLAACEEVWRYASDEEYGVVRPRPVTDRTISLARNGVADRYLVHYMQPHFPPLTEPPEWGTNFDPEEQVWDGTNPWELAEDGVLNRSRLREAYYANLALLKSHCFDTFPDESAVR